MIEGATHPLLTREEAGRLSRVRPLACVGELEINRCGRHYKQLPQSCEMREPRMECTVITFTSEAILVFQFIEPVGESQAAPSQPTERRRPW